MTNPSVNQKADKTRYVDADTTDRAADNNYDPHITPAETAARQEREGELFKTHPTEAREASAPTDDQTSSDSIHTTDGYTVDKEGLINNYAIEPEMYYEVPGDARQSEDADHAKRVDEYEEINQEQQGKLTADHDDRTKGPGVI
jgi:hypothetical protein